MGSRWEAGRGSREGSKGSRCSQGGGAAEGLEFGFRGENVEHGKKLLVLHVPVVLR